MARVLAPVTVRSSLLKVLLMDAVGVSAGREPLDEGQQAAPVPSTPAGTPEPDSVSRADNAGGSHSRSMGGWWRSWWRAHRGAFGRDAIVGLVVGIFLLAGAMFWDDRLADRQDRLARDLADQQNELARE